MIELKRTRLMLQIFVDGILKAEYKLKFILSRVEPLIKVLSSLAWWRDEMALRVRSALS